MVASTTTALTHSTETVSIVNEEAEAKVLLALNDNIEEAEVTLHTEDTLGDYEDTTILLLSKLSCVLKLKAQRLLIVVSIYETLTGVHTQTVDDTSVALLVVDHNIAGSKQAVDNRNHTLIAVVEKEGILLAYELSELTLKLLVVLCLT